MYAIFAVFLLFVAGLDLFIKVREKKSAGKSLYDSQQIMAIDSGRRI